MATTYEKAGSDVDDLIARMLKKHHPELAEAGVTVDAVFASAEKRGMSIVALRRQGYAIAAKIQITPLVDRARDVADTKLPNAEINKRRRAHRILPLPLDAARSFLNSIGGFESFWGC